MPNHCLCPGTKHFIGRAHVKKEEQEETEAQGEEETGKEEGEAAAKASDAFWSPWTGEWVFSGSNPGKNFTSHRKFELPLWINNHIL